MKTLINILLIINCNIIAAQNTSEIEGNLIIKDTLTIQSFEANNAELSYIYSDSLGNIVKGQNIQKIAIPASSFVYESNNATFEYSTAPRLVVWNNTGFARFYAPIIIPIGAQIRKFGVHIVDASASGDLKCTLIRFNASTFNAFPMAQVVSTGIISSDNEDSQLIFSQFIDGNDQFGEDYHYYIEVESFNWDERNTSIWGAVIEYEQAINK